MFGVEASSSSSWGTLCNSKLTGTHLGYLKNMTFFSWDLRYSTLGYPISNVVKKLNKSNLERSWKNSQKI